MKNVIIVGGNSGARLIYELCEINNYNVIGFASNFTQKWYGITPNIIGDIEKPEILDLIKKNDYFVATGDNKMRETITNFIIKKTNKNPINIIHPSSIISKYAKIGTGNLIMSNVVINNNTSIGDGTIINTSSVIEHDNIIDDYCQISPNTTLCGYINIGKFCFIGANSVIIPHISIKKNSIIGAGSVIIKNVEPNVLVVGNPGKIKKII
jgi:acetyltransferase EpsM